MYTKHHTEGIVLKKYHVGESDGGFLILTRDLGLIYGRAQSVREQKSRLRFGLQELSVSRLSFVRGREVWRITHAEPHIMPHLHILAGDAARGMVRRFVRLLLRLVPPEEPAPELYDIVRYAFVYLDSSALSEEEVLNLEALVALRTLRQLGYLGSSKHLSYVLASPYVNDMLIAEMKRVRTSAVRQINQTLRELPL